MDSQHVTQKELAIRSGVSRPQLSRILQQNRATVRAGTLERLAMGLRCEQSELLAGDPIQEFKAAQAEEVGYVDFRGLGMPRLERLPVAEVFIDVALDVDSEFAGDCQEGVQKPQGFAGRERPSVGTFGECVRSSDRCLLLGDPGSGKTTLLRHYAADEQAEQAVPILIRLSEFVRYAEHNPQADVLNFVESRRFAQQIRGLRQSLKQQAEDGHCQFLLDGLDEVGGREQRELAIGKLKEVIESFPRCRFAMTSRIIGFAAEPWQSLGFTAYRLRGYSRSQHHAFAEKWSQILSRADQRSSDAIRNEIEEAIFTNPRVRSLASNPLVLTILVLLNSSRGGSLPRRRVDLYEKVVDVFLETWESSRQQRAELDDVSNIDIDAREFRWMLSDVALAMQKSQLTLAARWWLAERVQSYLCTRLGFMSDDAKQAADRIIRYLTERTGLLAERGPDLFGFSHRTMQEYFASLGVIDEANASRTRDVTECLREFFYHPQWSEVVRLTAAQLTPPLAENLVASILDDPDSIGRFLHRGGFLALRCLADGTTVANRRLTESLFEQLHPLGRSRWLGTTFEALHLLNSLEGTRHESLASDTKRVIVDTAREELGHEEFIAVKEFVCWKELAALIDEELASQPRDAAAWKLEVEFCETRHEVIVLNAELRLKQPHEWYEAACRILEDASTDRMLKLEVIRELRQRVASQPKARIGLRKLLRDSPDTAVRVACAVALAPVATGKHNVKSALLRSLANDRDDEVRASCATSLNAAADDDAAVMQTLIGLLKSDASDVVRSGAARGLSMVADADHDACRTLVSTLNDESSPDKLKTACVWSLSDLIDREQGEEDLIGQYRALALTAADSMAGRAAAQVLIRAMAEERIRWDAELANELQHLLMNLTAPCAHVLESLRQLADARETNCGLRLESVLRESLRSVWPQVGLAFVFGSTARREQHPGSDIDLMLIGDVRLRAVSPLLATAEHQLGRRINPAIYSLESFRDKYQTGDPFLQDVMRREKLPVCAGSNGVTLKELERELGELVAERLADS